VPVNTAQRLVSGEFVLEFLHAGDRLGGCGCDRSFGLLAVGGSSVSALMQSVSLSGTEHAGEDHGKDQAV
jgi:hypothetical protein